MTAVVLQGKIEELLSTVRQLLPAGSDKGCVYADDLSDLHYNIQRQINELYSYRGYTVEQDATLCLALLSGYSVSMYANPEDESKKQNVLLRSQVLLPTLSPSSLKEQLFTLCHELTYSFEIH